MSYLTPEMIEAVTYPLFGCIGLCYFLYIIDKAFD